MEHSVSQIEMVALSFQFEFFFPQTYSYLQTEEL